MSTEAGEDHSEVEATPIVAAIRRLVPRDNVWPGRPAVVNRREYLARLGSLHRKCTGLVYRYEHWTSLVTETRKSFDELARYSEGCPPIRARAPDTKVTGHRNSSYTDLRIENELEAFLFAVRSTLDILGRVVASHYANDPNVNSYRELRKRLEKHEAGKPITRAVSRAWVEWIDEVATRRDAAGHYVALAAPSIVREHWEADEMTLKSVFIAIPEVANKGSIPIWWGDLPMLLQQHSVAFEYQDPATGETVRREAHGAWDFEGRAVLIEEGPRPTPPMIDGSAYVTSVRDRVDAHVQEVLGCLAEPW